MHQYLRLGHGKFCVYKPYIDEVMALKARGPLIMEHRVLLDVNTQV